MPINQNGDTVCINHPEEVLTNQTFVSFRKIMVGTNQDTGDNGIMNLNESLPAKIRFCDRCGYMELYTIHLDDYPSKNEE